MVEQLFEELARMGVVLVADSDRLRFYPRDKVTPELVKRLKEHKAEVLAIMADPWPEDYVEPDPCPDCGGLELWETMTGRWRCMKCDPPTKTIKILERARQIRRRYGLSDPVGAAKLRLMHQKTNTG